VSIEIANLGFRTLQDQSEITAPSLMSRPVRILAICVLWMGIVTSPLVFAESKSTSLEVNDAEFELTEYPATSADTVLWITSGADPEGHYERSAKLLTKKGVSVVKTDILDAYLLDNSRGAMVDVPPEDLVALYEHVLASRSGRLVVMAAGRVGIPVLRAINLWQIKHADRGAIAGTILVSPNLYLGVPELGDVGKFYPIAEVSKIPTFIVQPRLSIRAFRLQEVAKQLGLSGSPIYTGIAKALHGGFFFNATEVEEPDPLIAELVSTVTRASKLLWRSREHRHWPSRYSTEHQPNSTTTKAKLSSLTSGRRGVHHVWKKFHRWSSFMMSTKSLVRKSSYWL